MTTLLDLIAQARARQADRDRAAEERRLAQEHAERQRQIAQFGDDLGCHFGPDAAAHLDLRVVWGDQGPAGHIAHDRLTCTLTLLGAPHNQVWYLGQPGAPTCYGDVGGLNCHDQEPDQVQQRFDRLLLKIGAALEYTPPPDDDAIPF